LAARIALPGSDELSAIAEDFNVMTDRLRAYRQSSLGDLIQAQEAAQSAIDSLSDPVLVFDAKGAVINVNRAAGAAFAIEDDHLDLARLEPALQEAVERARGHVLAGRGPYVPKGFEEAVASHTPEGSRFFLVRATPVYATEGGVAGTTVVLQDVTRLRLFDELKNDLVATVAHEFRSPLTSLRMAIHLCLEGVPGPLTAKQQEVLYTAREDCERLQDIVEDLLDVARIQAGRLELARRRVSVSELLHKVAAGHRREAEARKLTLWVEPAPADLAVAVDLERIDLVFSNLLNNAIHFTPEGGRVEVRVRPVEAGAMARFEISDTGPGVPEEYRARIFEKFFQVPGAPKGTAGLGLYIAREIVLGHGGEMGMDSQTGNGSTFWFTLPSAPRA
ncbi:MAG TPA: ATP-binding protein, partial [Myxococcaceae bacterium]|nr:ATP-binding protein [Myxococcaceae bacterium]